MVMLCFTCNAKCFQLQVYVQKYVNKYFDELLANLNT